MRIRFDIRVWLLACLLAPCLTAAALGQEYHIQQGGTGPNTYFTLEAFRLAVPVLNDGDVIVLYNDDIGSLTDGFDFGLNKRVTVRTADGRQYIVKGQPDQFLTTNYLFAAGDESDPTSRPTMTLENLHVLDNTQLTSGVVYLAGGAGSNRGTLNVSNSIFENNGGDIDVIGNATVNLLNTQFINNRIVNGLYVDNIAGESTSINLAVDANGPRTTKWVSDQTNLTGIFINNGGTVAINADVAQGKNLDIRGYISNDSGDPDNPNNRVTITKTGAGVMKLWNGGGGNIDINIQEGILHFGPNSAWITNYDPATSTVTNNTIHVGSNGVFKVTWNPGNVEEYYQNGSPQNMNRSDTISQFLLTRFTSDPGARTEIGNISMFPVTPITQAKGADSTSTTTWTYGQGVILVPKGTTEANTPASTMNIDNRLMKATWKSGDSSDPNLNTTVEAAIADKDVWILHLERLNGLAVLDGVGDYADVYRRLDTLTEEERDALDHIYATGGIGGAELGYLQTLGGVMVQNSMVAMRQNYNNLWRRVNQRLTSFHREELEMEVTGSDFCYSDQDPSTQYGELWAYIDQTWHNQDDVENIAGYTYNPYGLGIGYEKHMDEWIFGGVMQYDGGKMKLKSHGATHTDVDNLLLTGYASWASEGYYLTGGAHLGYGWNNSISSYTMPGLVSTANSGNYSTSLYGASVEGGYMMSTGYGDFPLRVTPYAGLGYARINREGFTETGAGSLNRRFAKADWDMWEFTAGFRLSMPIERKGYVLIPSADVSFVRTMGTPGGDSNCVTLISNPAGTWNPEVMGANRSALHISAGLNARFGDNWDVGMGYDFEWRKQGISNQLNLNVTKGF